MSRFALPGLVSLLMIFSLSAHAALPVTDSQGERLPTLAPMLERVTPAVVNIATTGHVRIQENPLFSDCLLYTSDAADDSVLV